MYSIIYEKDSLNILLVTNNFRGLMAEYDDNLERNFNIPLGDLGVLEIPMEQSISFFDVTLSRNEQWEVVANIIQKPDTPNELSDLRAELLGLQMAMAELTILLAGGEA